MIGNKKIVIVLPAYNAGKTLEQTYAEIPMDIVDEVVLVDDASKDDTGSGYNTSLNMKTIRVMAEIRNPVTIRLFR